MKTEVEIQWQCRHVVKSPCVGEKMTEGKYVKQ